MDKYTKIENIASGAYGSVCKYKEDTTNDIYAIKRIMPKNMDSFLREICNNAKCSHPNIIKIKEVIMELDDHGEIKYCNIVMPYIEKTLTQHIRDNKITDNQIIQYCKQLLSAVNHLHNNNIYHRDLKPDNILVQDGNVYICDFGSSRNVSDAHNMTCIVQSAWYRAPEILLNTKEYNEKIDMWSVGCIIAEMINGSILFEAQSEISLLLKIFIFLGTPSEKFLNKYGNHNFPPFRGKEMNSFIRTEDNILLELCKGLLCIDPEKRLSCSQAMKILTPDYIDSYELYKYEDIRYNIIEDLGINATIRKILYDWMLEVKCEYKLSDITLFNAYNIMDKYGSICKIHKKEYQLYGIVALHLSSLLHDINPISNNASIMMTNNAYTISQFNIALYNVLTKLNYHIDISSFNIFTIYRTKVTDFILIIHYMFICPEFYKFSYDMMCKLLEMFYNAYDLWKKERKIDIDDLILIFGEYFINIKLLPEHIKSYFLFEEMKTSNCNLYNFISYISNILS